MNLFFGMTAGEFCTQSAVQNILGLLKLVITIFKWAIPILLIVVGSFDLGKAVIDQKPENIQKAYNGLIKRAIAAIVIFFIPSIVGLLMEAIGNAASNDMSACTSALGISMK